MRNTKKIATTAVAALAFTGVGAVAEAAFNPTVGPRHVVVPKRPCKSEDGPAPCYWDAGVRGNGHGRSYWIDRKHRIHYLSWGMQKRSGSGEWVPLPKRFYPKHQPCYVFIDYTSRIRCADGFHTTS